MPTFVTLICVLIFRHVAILKITGKEMEFEKIPLQTVRQLYVETIGLSACVPKGVTPEKTEKNVRHYLKQRVEALLAEAANNRSGHRDQPQKPLIRLRVSIET